MQQIVCIAVTRLAYLLPKLCTAQEKIPLETLENAVSSQPDGFVLCFPSQNDAYSNIFYECCLFYFCFCVILMMQPYGVFFATPFTIE